jgi:flagellar hook protein FlgE
MNSLPSIAHSGLQAASTQLGAAAHNLANAQTMGFRRQQVVQESEASGGVRATLVRAEEPGVSLPDTLVQQRVAGYAYKANALTLQTHQRMLGSLLDTQA